MAHCNCPNCCATPCKCKHKQAKKNDITDDKLRVDLLPIVPLLDVARVFTFGAKKYGEKNWEKGLPWMRCFGATIRHLWAWVIGETWDRESGINHLAHVIANCLFLLEYSHTHRELDDRPVKQDLNITNLFKTIEEQKHE